MAASAAVVPSGTDAKPLSISPIPPPNPWDEKLSISPIPPPNPWDEK